MFVVSIMFLIISPNAISITNTYNNNNNKIITKYKTFTTKYNYKYNNYKYNNYKYTPQISCNIIYFRKIACFRCIIVKFL
jgi:hypothetical protein